MLGLGLGYLFVCSAGSGQLIGYRFHYKAFSSWLLGLMCNRLLRRERWFVLGHVCYVNWHTSGANLNQAGRASSPSAIIQRLTHSCPKTCTTVNLSNLSTYPERISTNIWMQNIDYNTTHTSPTNVLWIYDLIQSDFQVWRSRCITIKVYPLIWTYIVSYYK